MNRIVFLGILLSLKAFALGPIPNGTYTGSETCTGYDPISTRVEISDTSMKWDDLTYAFDTDRNGFFKVHTLDGSGTGLGHFTADGVHYEVIFDMLIDGKTLPVPGEDTFSFSQGVLRLNASASMQAGGIMKCSGVFKLAQHFNGPV